VGAVLAFESSNVKDKLVYFMGIDGARFRRPVLPGDTVEFVLEVKRRRGTIWTFKAEAYVGEKLAAEAELMATIVERQG
jgi:3-hydroxyacyl-[acyl-carrier-protein] dehydratase